MTLRFRSGIASRAEIRVRVVTFRLVVLGGLAGRTAVGLEIAVVGIRVVGISMVLIGLVLAGLIGLAVGIFKDSFFEAIAFGDVVVCGFAISAVYVLLVLFVVKRPEFALLFGFEAVAERFARIVGLARVVLPRIGVGI